MLDCLPWLCLFNTFRFWDVSFMNYSNCLSRSPHLLRTISIWSFQLLPKEVSSRVLLLLGITIELLASRALSSPSFSLSSWPSLTSLTRRSPELLLSWMDGSPPSVNLDEIIESLWDLLLLSRLMPGVVLLREAVPLLPPVKFFISFLTLSSISLMNSMSLLACCRSAFWFSISIFSSLCKTSFSSDSRWLSFPFNSSVSWMILSNYTRLSLVANSPLIFSASSLSRVICAIASSISLSRTFIFSSNCNWVVKSSSPTRLVATAFS